MYVLCFGFNKTLLQVPEILRNKFTFSDDDSHKWIPVWNAVCAKVKTMKTYGQICKNFAMVKFAKKLFCFIAKKKRWEVIKKRWDY
jgi:hypothetical protein